MDPIQEYTNRPKKYVNIDGLGEASIGLIIAAFPLCSWLAALAPTGYGLRLALELLPILLVVWAPRGAEAVRKRITYQRTGFVEQRRDPLLVQILLVVGLLFLVIYTLVLVPPLRNVRPSVAIAIYGVLLAGGYAYEFARAVRWKWVVALILACGFLTVSMLGRDAYGWWWLGCLGRLFGFVGITWVVSGSITFYEYLRHTQPAARTVE
jgi:hypothetical protein